MINWRWLLQEAGELGRLLAFMVLLLLSFVGAWHILSLIGI